MLTKTEGTEDGKKSKSVFALLAKPVQRALAETGFTEPTLPQTMAFPSILSGKRELEKPKPFFSPYSANWLSRKRKTKKAYKSSISPLCVR